MHNKRFQRAAGFSVLELIVVVAIIGLIASIVLPHMFDMIDKAKQKRTLADMHAVSTALTAWLIDQTGAAAAGRQVVSLDNYTPASYGELETMLVPNYLKQMPVHDGWGHPYDYYFNSERIQQLSVDVLGIRSRGRDGIAEANAYTVGSFSATDYDQDIVWADTTFVRWPESAYEDESDSDQSDSDSGDSDSGDSDSTDSDSGDSDSTDSDSGDSDSGDSDSGDSDSGDSDSGDSDSTDSDSTDSDSGDSDSTDSDSGDSDN